MSLSETNTYRSPLKIYDTLSITCATSAVVSFGMTVLGGLALLGSGDKGEFTPQQRELAIVATVACSAICATSSVAVAVIKMMRD